MNVRLVKKTELTNDINEIIEPKLDTTFHP